MNPALKDAIANEQTKVADGQAREAEAKADKAVAEAQEAVKRAEAANKRAEIEGYRLDGMTNKEALEAYLESLRIAAGRAGASGASPFAREHVSCAVS